MVTEDDARRAAVSLAEPKAPVPASATPRERDAEADEATAPATATPDPPASPPGPSRWIGWAAIVLGTVPILIVGVRAAARGWTPTGDDAYSAVRAHDVFSSNVPLLATWSSASEYTGHQINHPGALHFDLLAIPVRLLGHGPGTAIGMALVNAVAVALVGWLMARRFGPPGAVLAMAAATLLTWSMGSEMLYDPWSQHAPLLPFLLFLVAVWCVVAGDVVALPIMVVAGSYALQTHLSYTILVPGLTAFALVGLAALCLHQRRNDPEGWATARPRTVRWLAIAALTWLVVTLQPLIEQFTADGEGNLTALVRSRGAEVPTPTIGDAVRALGGTIVLPPAWLPPSYRSPSFHTDGTGRPTWLAATALAAVAVALVVLGRRAWRRGSVAVTAGLATAGAVLALGLVSIAEAPVRWGLVPTYLRWMWPAGMVVWLALGVAVVDEVRARRPATDQRPRVPLAPALGLALTLVAAAATLPTVDNGSGSPAWTVDALDQIDDDVLAAVGDEPGVLVEMTVGLGVGATGPALFATLQDAGVPFYVDEVALVRQLGTARAFQPGDATVRLTVRSGRGAEAGPGERLVAESVPRVPGSIGSPPPDDRVIKVYVSALP